MKLHLKGEDDSLYPRLLAHEDADVRAKANQLQRSIGGLATAFNAFYAKWIKPNAIGDDVDGYTVEMRDMVDALARRMDMEDNELYDLADRSLRGATKVALV